MQRHATSTSSVGLPATLQYAIAGRCLFPGGMGLRIASGLCVLTVPLARLANRIGGGGDQLHVVATAGPGGMSRPLKILIVAYFYPPQNITGARRPAALAKWLGRRGHEASVLTSRQSGTGPDPAGARITRTRDLLATRLNWRGDSLKVVTGASDATWSPGANFWGAIVVPDVQLLSWLPFAVAAARRLQRRHGFDAVITTSPIESAHLVGLALQRQGVAWIADLRDGWRFEAPREEWPLAAQRRADDVLERLVVRRADAVVTVTEPLSADLRRRHGIVVETITNGFDPDDAPPAPAAPAGRGASSRSCTPAGWARSGRCGPCSRRSPGWRRTTRDCAGRVELVLAGPADRAGARALRDARVRALRPGGRLPRPAGDGGAAALRRRAAPGHVRHPHGRGDRQAATSTSPPGGRSSSSAAAAPRGRS